MIQKQKKPDLKLIAALLLALGFVFILISALGGENEPDTPSFDEKQYGEELEKRLTSLIGEIKGVGKVSVMVTLEGSAVYEYATDVDRDVKDGSTKSSKSVVLSVKGSNTKDAVVSGYILPKVNGVAVVCSGKLTPSLQTRVTGVVSCALGVPTNKIYVTN